MCDWTNNIKGSSCEFKIYTIFEYISRDHFNNLINEAKVYDKIKKDVNIIINRLEKIYIFI